MKSGILGHTETAISTPVDVSPAVQQARKEYEVSVEERETVRQERKTLEAQIPRRMIGTTRVMDPARNSAAREAWDALPEVQKREEAADKAVNEKGDRLWLQIEAELSKWKPKVDEQIAADLIEFHASLKATKAALARLAEHRGTRDWLSRFRVARGHGGSLVYEADCQYRGPSSPTVDVSSARRMDTFVPADVLVELLAKVEIEDAPKSYVTKSGVRIVRSR